MFYFYLLVIFYFSCSESPVTVPHLVSVSAGAGSLVPVVTWEQSQLSDNTSSKLELSRFNSGQKLEDFKTGRKGEGIMNLSSWIMWSSYESFYSKFEVSLLAHLSVPGTPPAPAPRSCPRTRTRSCAGWTCPRARTGPRRRARSRSRTPRAPPAPPPATPPARPAPAPPSLLRVRHFSNVNIYFHRQMPL